MRAGGHFRGNRSRRLTWLRVLIVVMVPVFIVVQPTGATTSLRLAGVTTTKTTRATPPTSLRLVATMTTSTTIPPTTTTEAPTTTPPSTESTKPKPPRPPQRFNGGLVTLTFDDGPNPTYTPQILDILARYGVHATFFMVGREVQESPDLVRRVLAAGHTVGNHTWDHLDLTQLSDEQFAAQIDPTEELLNSIVGGFVPCVRPPEGRTNAHVVELLNSRGLRQVKWSKDTEDWKRPGVQAIVDRAIGGAKPGAVILMHDSGPDMSETVAALPTIIEGIVSRGLQISSMCGAQ